MLARNAQSESSSTSIRARDDIRVAVEAFSMRIGPARARVPAPMKRIVALLDEICAPCPRRRGKIAGAAEKCLRFWARARAPWVGGNMHRRWLALLTCL